MKIAHSKKQRIVGRLSTCHKWSGILHFFLKHRCRPGTCECRKPWQKRYKAESIAFPIFFVKKTSRTTFFCQVERLYVKLPLNKNDSVTIGRHPSICLEIKLTIEALLSFIELLVILFHFLLDKGLFIQKILLVHLLK